MPSAPADPPPSAGRPRWWAAGLLLSGVLLLLAVGAALLLGRQPDAAPPDRDVGADPRAAAAARLLGRLGPRLERGTRSEVVALAAPGDRGAASELLTLRDNVRALGMADLSLRYVAAGTRPSDRPSDRPAESPAESPAGTPPGDATWVGEVLVAWRLPGIDTGTTRMRVPVTFAQTAGVTGFVTARSDQEGAVPLWMLDRVSVTRTAHSVVVATGPEAGVARLADRAVVDVGRVLRGWSGRVVVEVPRDQRELRRVLGAHRGEYTAIAALATTVDGSLSHDAPVHVFVNPQVFGPLGPRGSQIVMSHEVTHLAVGAERSSMPPWLLEGFADYVALAHADIPVSRSASQILEQVRRDGVPATLPTAADFAPGNSRLGASYESAWLACRLIADRYGERRLVSFYRASDREGATGTAFRAVLDTDEEAFTRAWRADLRRLARSAVG